MRKLFFFLSFLFSVSAFAQPYAKEIAEFKRADSLAFPAKGQILFIGSSSFTYWKDVNEYFQGKQILNRAFGGSSLTDLIRYEKELLSSYQPRQIVIYCGENDFANEDTLKPNDVVKRFKTLFTMLRKDLPKVPIAYVSMKPSPSRAKLLPKFRIANEKIQAFLAAKKRTAFINVYPAMLNEFGKPKPEIFKSDSLHMNPSGYAIWKPIIQPYLK